MADVQELITDLKIRDNLSVGLANAKASVVGFGTAAETSAAKADGAFSRLGTTVKTLAGGLLAFSAANLAVGFLKDSVTAANEAELSNKRLAASLEANVPAWDGNTAAIERAVAAGQKLAFDDEDIQDSLAKLVGATNDVNRALAIQNTAMDLARFKGVSLAEATTALVTIEAGRFRGLAQLGIVLKEGTTQTEALAAVQKVAAGQAEVFAGTTVGAMERAGVAVENLQEKIGDRLSPAVTKLANAIADLADSGNLERSFEPGLAPILSVTAGMRTFVDVVKDATNALGDLNKEQAEGAATQELSRALGALQARFAEGKISEDEYRRAAEDLEAGFQSLIVATDGFSHVAQETREHTLAAGAAFDRAHDSTERLAAAEKALNAETANVSAAQLRVAQATIDAAAAHADVANAQKAAAEAADGDTAAIVALAEAMAANKRATDELKAAQDALNGSTATITTSTLGAGRGLDGLATALSASALAALKASVGYGLAADQLDRLKGTAGKPFVAPTTVKIPGLEAGEGQQTGVGLTLAESFLEDLAQDQRNLEAETARSLGRLTTSTSTFAGVVKDKLGGAFDATKRTAETLFDKLHERNLRAIADTQKLADAQHTAATQQIADALKLRLDQNAAPVTAAEESQRRIEIGRQRRDLQASLQTAVASGDPVAIRNAQEALQSFNAQQRINALKLTQSTLDLAAQKQAAADQKAADDKLAAAKLAQAAAITAETDRDKKLRVDFDKALAALRIKDKGASPAKLASDIGKLEKQFGITTDERGFHHIAAAIKTIKIPQPQVYLTATINSPAIVLNGRLIAAALASSQSVTATPTVRTGALKPRP